MHALPSGIHPLAGAVILAVALAPSPAAAQAASPPAAKATVAPGARVRVTSSAAAPRVGTLVTLTADTLVARWASGDSGAVALDQLTRLEVSRGQRRHPWRGAGIGLLAGAAAGAVIGAASYESCAGRENCIQWGGRGSNATAAAVVIGAGGALVGLVAGALSPSEAWRPVTLQRGRVGLVVPPRGTGVGAGLAF